MNEEVDIPDAQRKFSSINGWIDLKNYSEAAEELNNLEPRLKSTVHFVKAWIRIYSATEAWTNVELMCATLLKHAPDDAFGIRHLAEAFHRQGQHVEAISKLGELLSNVDRRQAPTILYDLARYFCAAGQLKEARECLRKAVEADESLKKTANEDPAFEKLWTEEQGGKDRRN
jgi:tetratricopeptide (TPR) repeat protein